MQIINTVAALRDRLATESTISLVPTMGNLHAGHIELVKLAKQQPPQSQNPPCVVVSIFVNPLQFGANEDLASYPRTLAADCEKLKLAGADVLFAPSTSELYPNFDVSSQELGQSMSINPPPIANELCGKVRPNHFSGVATVVLKLFNIVFFNKARSSEAISGQSTYSALAQNNAIFGKKDFQQLFIIHELVRQFNLPINIVEGKTVREADGLAMSSRNNYLDSTQRIEAPALHNTLKQLVTTLQESAKKFSSDGNEFTNAEQQATAYLTARGWFVDYISIRASNTLALAQYKDTHLVVLGAARLGKTRLIDNIEFSLQSN